jgi:MGT family glycosyltransferase
MNKIIFLGSPAYGHVNPTLPVVQELVQRGEQVIYYNTEEFRPTIEPTGATFHPYPPIELTATTIAAALQNGNLANVTGLVLRTTEALLPFLLDELASEQPHFVLFDSLALWGKMATTQLGLLAAASITHFVFDLREVAMTGRDLLRLLGQYLPKLPQILPIRQRLIRRYPDGYPRERPLFPMRDRLNIVFTIRELQPDTALINDTFRFVGPSINPQMRPDRDFPFQELGEGLVVYISLGTVHHGRAEFYKACFQAFADYPAQFVLSAGRDTNIASLGEIPANFIARPSVPQLELLQHTDLFITHGGINSLHEGLYYGVPLILIPHQQEQLLNARRVEAQGAGLIIPDQLERGRLTAATLRHALEEALSKPSYQEAANKVQHLLRASGGYRQAADEIQAFLRTQKNTDFTD